MQLVRLWPLLPLQLRHRRQYPLPDLLALQVALLQHGIGPAGSFQCRVLAVLADQHRGRAVDVEFVNGQGTFPLVY